MWEMLDSASEECGNECWGPGPPPEFLIPPPPRPSFLHESLKCTEEQPTDAEMCEAIPIIDASYHSSPSIQTSTMIAVCSILLVVVILLSSLFMWKHKRKVQNFFPCKTPTRGHLDTTMSGGHSVTYEDPDAHMGRRPLVMRHHNMEMLHSKALHYPSGYPMTRSPPLFVCSSPGPDPYRSHDNVYEELGPPRDSDAESDVALHSDDDFAEDESSLPGERSVIKLAPHEVTPTVATIYHERVGTGGAVVNGNGGCCILERSLNERNSLLSSSSSDRNGCGSSSGYGNGNGPNSTVRNSTSPDSGRLFLGGRRLFTNRTKQRTYSTDELNTSSEQAPSDVVPTIYDERNLLTLPYSHSNSFNDHSSNHRIKSINVCNSTVTNDEVERRNHINNQLSNNSVSTIYRGRTVINGRNGIIHQPSLNYHNNHSNRSRTNPRSLDRRRITTTLPSPNNDTSYVYTEPMYHDGVVYDSCLTHQMNDRNHLYPYILPEFTSFRNMTNSMSEQPNQPIHPIYSRDSSFGSDSGYSHHTQTSGRGGGSGSGGGNSNSNHSAGTLSSINFGWGRNKENAPRKGNNTFETS